MGDRDSLDVDRDGEGEYEDKQWLAQRLREALKLSGLKQTDLLQLLEENGYPVKQQRLSHLMNGRNYPDPLDLRELVRAMGVSSDWMLRLTEQSLPAADLDEMLSQAKGEGRIGRIMRQLSKDQQEEVVNFAEFLLSQKKTAKPAQTISEWIAATEVLVRRHGIEGEESFMAVLAAERPDLAAALGILSEKKTIQER